MRKLTILVLALAAIYSGYWFVGAAAVERTATAQIEQMRQDGWTLDYESLKTQGYPSRFDTTVTTFNVITPSGNLAWQAPFMEVLSLSYKPNEIILALPDRQNLTLGGVPLTLTSDRLRASATVAANTDIDLTRFTAEVRLMTADSASGTVFSLSNALIALRPTENAPLSYDTFLNIDDLALPLPLRQIIDPTNKFPPILSQITIDASITTDRKLDRNVIMDLRRPQIDALKLNGMTLAWGPLSLRGQGEVTIDPDGVPAGQFTLEAQNWREMVQMAVNAGLIERRVSNTLQNMGAILAGGSNNLSLPVSFQNGMMLIGPVPLGPAPRFR
tara:strand:- start:35730 stop:36719 length:990 start_codon:yes stop_codon:yes gene_type:complete